MRRGPSVRGEKERREERRWTKEVRTGEEGWVVRGEREERRVERAERVSVSQAVVGRIGPVGAEATGVGVGGDVEGEKDETSSEREAVVGARRSAVMSSEMAATMRRERRSREAVMAAEG